MNHKNKKYSVFIFDLDGTLLNSQDDIADAINATIVKFNKDPLPDEEVKGHVGHGVRDLIHGVLGGAVPLALENEVLNFFNDAYFDICLNKTSLMPGGRELIDHLRDKKIPMAVHTNKPVRFTDKILDGMGLRKYFSAVMASEGGYPNKPHVDGTNALFKTLNVSPKDCLMIGDSDVDLMTGENVGMDVALSTIGFTKREKIIAMQERTVCVFEDLRDLMKFVA